MLDDLLDQLRALGDNPADTLVAALAQYHDVRELIVLLQKLIRLSDEAVMDLPIDDNVRAQFLDYLDRYSQLPAWANQSLMHRGSSNFRDHAMFAYLVLGCASLPNCYSWLDEARVLGSTLQLGDKVKVRRRIPETAQFVHDVMTRDGLNRRGAYTGVGVYSARKVRLMHAIMRHLLLSDPSSIDVQQPTSLGDLLVLMTWDVNDSGVPLNQEHLVGTLLTFSYTVLQGMKKYGLRIDPATMDAHIHAWNVVGYLLGVDEDVLRSHLATYTDTERMLLAIRRRNLARTDDGVDLATTLIGYFSGNSPRLLRFAPLILSRLLTGRAVSDKLETRYKLWHYPLVPLVIAALLLFAWLKNMAWTQKISNWFFSWLGHRLWDWRGQEWNLPDQ